MNNTILIADDDASIRFVVSKFLTKAGYKIQATDNAQTLLKWVKNGDGDAILTDVYMEAENVFNFIPEIKKLRPNLPIIVMSANTSVATALKSGSLNVFEYIPKPFDLEDIRKTLERALGPQKLIFKQKKTQTDLMIGKSVVMQPVFRAISDYTSKDIPVYIHGDVGTGKNHVATLLHTAGTRSEKPFAYFRDVGTYKELLEHTKNGDLFVDRIEELSTEKQALLLRTLEKNEQQSPNEKFRLVSTCSISPKDLQKINSIRPDLYYRMLGGEIYLPPLRYRDGDITALADHFLGMLQTKTPKTIAPKARAVLKEYLWPGNVLELNSLMRQICSQYADKTISEQIVTQLLNERSEDKSLQDSEADFTGKFDSIRSASMVLLNAPKNKGITPYEQALAWVEKPLIEEALKICGGNNSKAAKLLGIHRNTLRTKIRTLKIR